MTREEIYDAQIAPLMAQILEICKANKIPMLADFDLACEADDGLKCTSYLLETEWNPGSEMLRAKDCLLRRDQVDPVMITCDHGDGTKTLTAFL